MLVIPPLDDERKEPHYVQLYRHFRNEIATGRLPDNQRLPSIRKLAQDLALSTTPVEMAYAQLAAEGFIVSKPGSGYYVQAIPEAYRKLGEGKQRGQQTAGSVLPWDDQPYPYDFHLSRNDFTEFPHHIWRRLYQESLTAEGGKWLFYGHPQGEEGLRRAICHYLRQFRGVICTPEQIVIGAEQGWLLNVLSLLLKAHSPDIGVEDPGYPLFRSTFAAHGYQVVPIPLDEDGIHLEQLAASGVRLACVSPSHQFPRGMIMPIAKRLRLLAWAREADAYIIEDDYDGEFRYHGRPIPSLQGLVPDSRVIYLGGFAQSLAPAVAVHYLVLPAALLDGYRSLYMELLFEQSASPLHQRTLQRFMEQGHFARHVRKMRGVYRKKHDALVAALQRHMGVKADVVGRDAGFHLFLRVHNSLSPSELLRRAKSAGIRLASAAYTWHRPPAEPAREFLLGFGGIPVEKIEPGIKRLAEVWFAER